VSEHKASQWTIHLERVLEQPSSEDSPSMRSTERVLRDFFWRAPLVAHTPSSHLAVVLNGALDGRHRRR